MRKLLDIINTQLVIALMTVMVLSALLQVFSRAFSFSAPFTEELTIYAMMWVTLFGSSYAFGKKKHVAIDILSSYLGNKNKIKLAIIIELIVIAFAVLILIIGGGRFTWIAFKLEQISSVMHLPKFWVYIGLPISGIILLLYSIFNIKDTLKTQPS